MSIFFPLPTSIMLFNGSRHGGAAQNKWRMQARKVNFDFGMVGQRG